MNKNGITNESGSTASAVEEKIDSIRDTMKGLVDQGAQKVDAIKTKVVEVKDQAIDRGGDVVSRMSDLVKAHPLKSVGIAFATGYLGMRLFRR